MAPFDDVHLLGARPPAGRDSLGALGKKTNSTSQILIRSLAESTGGASSGSSFRPLRRVKFREWRSTRVITVA